MVKTTIATNIAEYYAMRGNRTTLLNIDPQGSATDWLAERPDTRAHIDGVYAADGTTRLPRGTEVLVMDAPAGAQGRDLSELLKRAQSAVIPVIPSPIDLRAMSRFYNDLIRLTRVSNNQIRIATVANRVRETSPTAYRSKISAQNEATRRP